MSSPATARGGVVMLHGDGELDSFATARGSVAALNCAVANCFYRPACRWNSLYKPPDTVTLTASDMGESGAGGVNICKATLAIVVTPVNDRPEIWLLGINRTTCDYDDMMDVTSVATATQQVVEDQPLKTRGIKVIDPRRDGDRRRIDPRLATAAEGRLQRQALARD